MALIARMDLEWRSSTTTAMIENRAVKSKISRRITSKKEKHCAQDENNNVELLEIGAWISFSERAKVMCVIQR